MKTSDFKDYSELFELVEQFFNSDVRKTKLWIMTNNPLLGGISPFAMIRAGRYAKLLKWVKQQLAGNEAPTEL